MESIPRQNNGGPNSTEWDTLLNQEQIDDMMQKGIYEPTGPEYRQALAEYGIHPTADNEAQKEPTWDSRLTKEQIDDMMQKGIYEPTGPEYHQALTEYGLKPQDVQEQEDTDQKKPGEPDVEDDQPTSPKGEKQDSDEDEDKDKGEKEKKEKSEGEEKEREEEEKKEIKKREEEIKEQLRQEYAKLGPLAAINADFTHDRAELARDYAEILLNEDQEKANLIKRIWKGSLFRKYYQKKYEREILEGKRSVGVDESGKEVGIDAIIEGRSGSAIRRFVLGATEDMRYIHEKIGKKDKNGKQDGEKLVEADEETTKIVRAAVENFAKAKVPEDGTLEDAKRNFENELKRLQAEARDDGRTLDKKLINNYFEVAMQARQRAEHGIAMDKVMEGFKVYNADVRNNIRTEAHRDNIDKIVNKLESSKIGKFIPAEVIAAAVGTVWSLTQSGARSAAKLAAPIGGIAVSGALAGLRERNRVTEDRARMIRDAAIGLEYSGTSDEEAKGRMAKKRAKYEAKIGGTIYDLKPAEELTSGIEKALESGDSQAILRAIAEARIRISFSDSEQKDLISYSSANKMGDERTKLDMAVIRAENGLSEEDKTKLEDIKAQVSKEITRNVDENDKNFKKIRTAQALKQAGKTIAIGSAVFFASQEIMAALDPNKIGLLEKAGIIKTDNSENAQETILAGLAGPRVRTEVHTDTITGIRGDQQTEIQQYEAAGYTKTMVKPAWTETKQGLADIDPSKSTARVNVAYDGWANNGTNVSDGNELRMYLSNGQIYSGMYGASTMGGQALDYDAAAIAGKVKGYLTIGGAKFEIASKLNSAGQLAWGENGVFTTTTGETIRAIGANGEKLYKYFEIALDNGTDANGVTHIIPFATDIGRDTFSGKMQQLVEKTIEHPAIYDFTKSTVTEIPREVFYGGVVGGPTSRVGLGGPRVGNPNAQGGETMINIDTTNGPEMYTGEEAEAIIGEGGRPTGGQTTTTGGATPPETPPTNPGENPTPPEEGNNPPEPTPGANNEPAPAPSETGQNPEATTDGFTELVRRDFGNIVGEEGVEFMTSETDFNSPDFPRARLMTWWNGLSDENKELVRSFANSSDNNTRLQGSGLRQFLEYQQTAPARS